MISNLLFQIILRNLLQNYVKNPIYANKICNFERKVCVYHFFVVLLHRILRKCVPMRTRRAKIIVYKQNGKIRIYY